MEGMRETRRKSTLHFREEVPGRNGHRPYAIFVIMRSEGSVVKITSVQMSGHMLRMQDIFFDSKKTWLP